MCLQRPHGKNLHNVECRSFSERPVMSSAERDRREVGGLLAHSPASENVRVGRFDNGRRAADSRADCASKCSNPGLGDVCHYAGVCRCRAVCRRNESFRCAGNDPGRAGVRTEARSITAASGSTAKRSSAAGSGRREPRRHPVDAKRPARDAMAAS